MFIKSIFIHHFVYLAGFILIIVSLLPGARLFKE